MRDSNLRGAHLGGAPDQSPRKEGPQSPGLQPHAWMRRASPAHQPATPRGPGAIGGREGGRREPAMRWEAKVALRGSTTGISGTDPLVGAGSRFACMCFGRIHTPGFVRTCTEVMGEEEEEKCKIDGRASYVCRGVLPREGVTYRCAHRLSAARKAATGKQACR